MKTIVLIFSLFVSLHSVQAASFECTREASKPATKTPGKITYKMPGDSRYTTEVDHCTGPKSVTEFSCGKTEPIEHNRKCIKCENGICER